eukprot:SAG11_NODE_28452_length_321_cov_1.157658_2_plen_67_part_01
MLRTENHRLNHSGRIKVLSHVEERRVVHRIVTIREAGINLDFGRTAFHERLMDRERESCDANESNFS